MTGRIAYDKTHWKINEQRAKDKEAVTHQYRQPNADANDMDGESGGAEI